MARKRPQPEAEAPALGRDPLADEDLVVRAFFTGEQAAVAAPAPARTRGEPAPKPTHYKVVSISLYNEDIERIDAIVAELRKRGHTRANRSSVIRFAIDTVDFTRMPRGY